MGRIRMLGAFAVALAVAPVAAQGENPKASLLEQCEPDKAGNYGATGELSLRLTPVFDATWGVFEVRGGQAGAPMALVIGIAPICPGTQHPLIGTGAVLVEGLATIGAVHLDASGGYRTALRLPRQSVSVYLQAVAFDPRNDGTPIQVSQGLRADFPMPATR
jgi:hypothetical protein